MRLIFEQDDGILGVTIPSPKFLVQLAKLDADGNDTVSMESKLIHIANKDLPTGTKYEIVEDDYPPSDRSFRNAWEYVSGADEKTSEDLSLDDQLKYNQITQEEYNASNN
jgi:hypothetical protein